MEHVRTKRIKDKNFNQPSLVKKSYLYLGVPPLIKIKKEIQMQNLIPKKRERFWGKIKPSCQFINEKEDNKSGVIELIIKNKNLKNSRFVIKKTSKISNLISHIINK